MQTNKQGNHQIRKTLLHEITKKEKQTMANRTWALGLRQQEVRVMEINQVSSIRFMMEMVFIL